MVVDAKLSTIFEITCLMVFALTNIFEINCLMVFALTNKFGFRIRTLQIHGGFVFSNQITILLLIIVDPKVSTNFPNDEARHCTWQVPIA